MSGHKERLYSQLRHRVPYAIFFSGFGLCSIINMGSAAIQFYVISTWIEMGREADCGVKHLDRGRNDDQ